MHDHHNNCSSFTEFLEFMIETLNRAIKLSITAKSLSLPQALTNLLVIFLTVSLRRKNALAIYITRLTSQISCGVEDNKVIKVQSEIEFLKYPLFRQFESTYINNRLEQQFTRKV